MNYTIYPSLCNTKKSYKDFGDKEVSDTQTHIHIYINIYAHALNDLGIQSMMI